MLFGDAGNFEQVFTGGHSSGGIIGEADEHGLGARGDGFANLLGIDIKIVFHLAGDFDGHATRRDNGCLVGDETGRGDDHLVPRIEQGNGCQVQCLGAADGDDDLVLGVIADTVKMLQVGGERLA